MCLFGEKGDVLQKSDVFTYKSIFKIASLAIVNQ